jgi:hypothetical protein
MTEEITNIDHTSDHTNIDHTSDNINNTEDGVSIESKHKIFVLYFEGLDRVGAPYGLNELIKKAKELELPIPSRKEVKSWRKKHIKR